jgi:hypothetical protein
VRFRPATCFVFFAVITAMSGSTASAIPDAVPRVFFDDFHYNTATQLERHGWIVRTAGGWPGVPGAVWRRENVSFANDPARRGNRLLRMTSSTTGGPGGTTQTQICHQRKYLAGTYAARVRFRDAPISGPDGDQVVQTFYMISPLFALDPDFSELDYEYLPNGGWRFPKTTFFAVTWETARLEPWYADNRSTRTRRSRAGWHRLVIQVADGTVKYYIDGARYASHGGAYYPEAPMSINFNLWFIADGLIGNGAVRSYQEDVDWAFHQAGVVLSPRQVNAIVARFRKARIRFRDTVPPASPRLASPCDL